MIYLHLQAACNNTQGNADAMRKERKSKETPLLKHDVFPLVVPLPRQVEYVTICVVTSLVTFVFWPLLSRVSVLSHMGTGMDGWLSQAIDTIGLASFAVAGTQHGIRRAAHPGITIVICCVTCSGGGILRDVSQPSHVHTSLLFFTLLLFVAFFAI